LDLGRQEERGGGVGGPGRSLKPPPPLLQRQSTFNNNAMDHFQFLVRDSSAAQLAQQASVLDRQIDSLDAEIARMKAHSDALKAELVTIRLDAERQQRAEIPREFVRRVMDGAGVTMIVAEESLIAAANNVSFAIELLTSQNTTRAHHQPAHTTRPFLPPGATRAVHAPCPPPNPSQLYNDAGYPMTRATNGTCYCSRMLGTAAIPNSDGQCGPHNGPSCADCRMAQLRLIGFM
jgi:hypothetical protein